MVLLPTEGTLVAKPHPFTILSLIPISFRPVTLRASVTSLSLIPISFSSGHFESLSDLSISISISFRPVTSRASVNSLSLSLSPLTQAVNRFIIVPHLEIAFHIMEPKNGIAIPGAQSILRGIQLLKAFDDRQPEWSLTELVDETGLNKTTVFRLLAALESEGLVRKSAEGAYRLGSEMIALGGRAMRANQLRTAAYEPLRALARETGETTTLEIIRPDTRGRPTTLVIDETLGRYRVGINQYIGSRLPIHATSTGKAMLAYSSPDVVKEVIRWKLPALTDQTIHRAKTLRQALEQIRSCGFALAAGELEGGVMAAAAPIFDHMNQVQAAVSVVGPSIRVDHAKLHEFGLLVKATTEEISRDLGWRERN